jgi:hypothetical protein
MNRGDRGVNVEVERTIYTGLGVDAGPQYAGGCEIVPRTHIPKQMP